MLDIEKEYGVKFVTVIASNYCYKSKIEVYNKEGVSHMWVGSNRDSYGIYNESTNSYWIGDERLNKVTKTEFFSKHLYDPISVYENTKTFKRMLVKHLIKDKLIGEVNDVATDKSKFVFYIPSGDMEINVPKEIFLSKWKSLQIHYLSEQDLFIKYGLMYYSPYGEDICVNYPSKDFHIPFGSEFLELLRSLRSRNITDSGREALRVKFQSLSDKYARI